MNGDEENGWPPIKQFQIEMTQNYPELWRVAHEIEGLICGSGIHAGGVIFVDEPFTESTALMRAPDGTICTQFELHDCEDVSLIKIDLLSVEAMDKIHNCIDLLCDYGYAERKATLRETYESIIGLYNLERDDPKMWQMVQNHEIGSLFQMEKQSGISGIEMTQPHSVDELAVLNSVIRLMASEKGAEQPLDMWARYRMNISEWYNEMYRYGLDQNQINWLNNNSAITNGVCESQEGLMSLLQDPLLGGNDLSFADKCRKAIAKKQGKLFEECEQAYFKNAEDKHCNMKLVHYVWDVLLRVQRGYSFCRAHTLAYSLVALQEMNLAYKYPITFWNCACLISDAGGNESEDLEEEAFTEEPTYFNEMEEFCSEDNEEDVEDSYEEEDCDGYPAEVCVMEGSKKKKKVKATNYGKISTAIGKIQSTGVLITPPDINTSTFTFSPDIKNNTIRYGLSGITRIGEDLIKTIIANRPYGGIDDFLSKIKINKPQMINLIKAGAFDSFGDRIVIMRQYIESISDKKKRITLQNMAMLINHNLIPIEYQHQVKVFNFNKYLKKNKSEQYYIIDDIAYRFYEKFYDIDKLISIDGTFRITQTYWDNIYNKEMDVIRGYFKNNQQTILDNLNNSLFEETFNKYCLGNISKWEMDSIGTYIHKHELNEVNNDLYDFANFFALPEEPIIERTFITKDKKVVPIFKIFRIAGTVLDRDKSKKMVTLLTNEGVVTVKIYGVFQQYDKQISERGVDGKKHIIEKSMFSRGNKIIVCGIKQDGTFIAKKYKNTPWHTVERIDKIEHGILSISNREITQ